MAHTIGGVTISNPIDGSIQYVRQKRWAAAEPLGYTGVIRTENGSRPLTHTLRYWLNSTDRAALESLYNAGAPVAWVYTDGDMAITSQTVLILTFDAEKNRMVSGIGLWDCDVVLEEVP